MFHLLDQELSHQFDIEKRANFCDLFSFNGIREKTSKQNYVNISKVPTQWCLLFICARIYVIEHIAVSVFFFL